MVPEKHFVAVETEEGHAPEIWRGFRAKSPALLTFQNLCNLC